MFQYLQYVAEHGQSPIQFRFEGASTQVSGDSLRMEMVVENRMGLPVIKLGGDYPAILDGEVTFLHLRTLGAEPLADPPDLTEVKGEGSATVALGDYFEAGDPGRHGWSVVIRDSWRELPGSMGRRQRLRVHGRRAHRRRSGQLGPCQTLRIEAMSSASTPPPSSRYPQGVGDQLGGCLHRIGVSMFWYREEEEEGVPVPGIPEAGY